jgi:hypothetical protein
MIRTTIAWIVFLGGFGIELQIDLLMRYRDGDVTTGGLPELAWYGVPILLGVVATILAWQGTRPLRRLWGRIAVVVGEFIVGLGIYILGCIWYVITNGIDTL